jgi:hypothetical protein
MSPYRIERKRRLDAAVRSPEASLCAKGHTIQNVGGWLKCIRCGTVLGKA